MKKFIISWDGGCGESFEVVEVEDEHEAEKIAYQNWEEDVKFNANYYVVGEVTEELLEEYGLEE